MAPSKHLVLICGYARSGKDTFAKGLLAGARNPIDKTAFADSLKEALRVAAHDVGIDVNYSQDEDKTQDRPLLVEFGRAMRRRNKNVFAKAVADEIKHMCDKHTYVVSDWRYLNEYEVMKEACDTLAINLHTVQVVRQGWSAANDEELVNYADILANVPLDESVYAADGDEESVILAGIRTAKLWKL